jgi:hypothetical protein
MSIDKILNKTPRARGVYASLRQLKTVAEGIRRCDSIGPGSLSYDYQPGNGLRYLVLFMYLTGGPGIEPRSHLVTDMLSGRSFVLAPEGFIAPGYITSKLGSGEADSAVLAEFIAHVTKRSAWTPDEYILNVFSEEA